MFKAGVGSVPCNAMWAGRPLWMDGALPSTWTSVALLVGGHGHGKGNGGSLDSKGLRDRPIG